MNTLSRILIALVILLANNFTNAQQVNKTNKLNVPYWSKVSNNAKVDHGYWSAKKDDTTICITLSDADSKNKANYEIMSCFKTSELNNKFEIVRNAGILKLNKNEGTFTFTKNEDYVSFLKAEDIKQDNELYYFKLFLADIDTEYISELKRLSFKPTLTEVGKLVWHDISIQFIVETQKKGLKSETIWDYINIKKQKN